jgi:uncharacterized FlaG/YvyC family protein
MKGIDTRIAIQGMAASAHAKSQSESHPEKLPVKDTAVKPAADNSQFNPVQTEVSFTTYGTKNEHLAVVVTNSETGEVIRELPTKEMQKLHGHLDVLV